MSLETAGLFVQGIGSLAGAWGQYENNKEQNKLRKKQFEYEKNKDDLVQAKLDTNQKNIDNAFADFTLDGTKKKKKKINDGVLSEQDLLPSMKL